jgi:cellulose synthase/poly-beta-1,6-N-acetylglucosamine synthase-like glycosyltransferase
MEWLAVLSIEQLMEIGFWDTRATLYIDIIVTYLMILPLLIGLSIYAAILERFKFHQVTQFLLFTMTLFALASFAYYVHFIVGFHELIEQNKVNYMYALLVLGFHIVIAIVMLVLWFFTLSYAVSDYKRRGLPGVYSASHKQSGRRVVYAIVLSSLSTALLYWVFFILS